jgi:two-component system, LuxR family, response regulator FixJ
MAEERTVYVVDDDDAVRDSVGLLLECKGYRVRVYASAAMFRRDLPPDRNSCLLLDADMPGIGGVELLNQLRRERITTPAIITIDGVDPRADAEAERVAGIVLQKPFQQGQLVACVAMALGCAQ